MTTAHLSTEQIPIFDDRHEAGMLLGIRLMKFRDKNPVVLAIPPGGIAVGLEVALMLGADFDIAGDAGSLPLAAAHRRASRLQPLGGRLVIVVADGAPNDGAMQDVLRAAHACGPSALVAAVPVGDPAAIEAIVREADEVVCLRMQQGLSSVRECYADQAAARRRAPGFPLIGCPA